MKVKKLPFIVMLQLVAFLFVLPECRADESVDSYFGARFKEGQGIEVSSETKKILSLETADVEQEQQGRQTFTIIPSSALLQTVTGNYVYVVNGKYFLRTQVSASNIDTNKIRITDGLFAGDEVVTRPVNSLWYVELQALRGGKACADGH